MGNSIKHGLALGAITFLISIIINLSSNALLGVSPIIISFMLLFFIVLLGIVFDIVGTAATAGSEEPFHAMASNRLPGAKHSIWLVKNADRVASILNDAIGDMAGTISGALGAIIVFRIVSGNASLSENLLNTLIIGIVAAITVGGKAIGKTVAIAKSTDIIYIAGRVLYSLEKFGIRIVKQANDKRYK